MTPSTNTSMSTVSALCGRPVYDRQGNKLGCITDIVLDAEAGVITCAILSFGGIKRLGSMLFAVPWQSLSFQVRDQCFRLQEDDSLLLDRPAMDADPWADIPDPRWEKDVHGHAVPYWETLQYYTG
jgi:sporulation protein YlmC with PRC-barrel domain